MLLLSLGAISLAIIECQRHFHFKLLPDLFNRAERLIEKNVKLGHQKEFFYKNISFNSIMSSGNLEEVRHLGKNHFSLKIASDPENATEPNTYRNWFHFQIKGFKQKRRITLSIHNMKYNWNMWKHGFSPVFKSNLKTKGNWKIFDLSPVKIYLKKKIMSLKFEFEFEPHEIVEFALTYPYTLERYQKFYEDLKAKFQQTENIQI